MTRRSSLVPLLGLLVAGCSLGEFDPQVALDAGRDASTGVDAGPDVPDAGADAGPEVLDAGADAACAAPELCNDVDDDCDPSTPDGADEPDLGAPCDGPDADECEEGTLACVAGGLACDDATDDSTESCNGADDDCDGEVDEGAGCPCERRVGPSSTYLFCADRREWLEARARCAGLGYALSTIEDAAEDDQVTAWAAAVRTEDWWIGLNDRVTEGTFVWVSGSGAPFRDWGDGEPNDFGGNQDCTQIADGSQAFETPGRWGDTDCADRLPYVCETSP